MGLLLGEMIGAGLLEGCERLLRMYYWTTDKRNEDEGRKGSNQREKMTPGIKWEVLREMERLKNLSVG